jgi:hypothetical protein
MDRELSQIIHIGVAMVMIAAVLSLVVPTLWLGRHLGYNYLSYTENLNASLTDGELEYLKDKELEMPSAGVFEILKANEDYANALYLDYSGLYGSASQGRLYDANSGAKTDTYKLFEKHISSKIKLYTVWNSSDSGYDFYIHDIACTSTNLMHTGACPTN